MSDAKLIDSAGIPQFTGNLEQLELDATTLTAEAILFRVNGALVHSNFQGLSAFYQAPEAEDLFATTAPVATKTDAFADDLEKVSQALTTYADEVRPLAAKLKSLQTEASSFYCNDVAGDEDWREDKDKVQHNNDLWHDVNTTMDAFWAAERACHNKITALVGGIQLKASDGESNCGTYGYKAEDLNHAESTPWGAPVEREYTGWAAVRHNIKSFVWDGFIIDGVVGTIKGLGTLVGTDGWEAAGQAWTGLAKLATGLAITLSPAGAAYWMAPKDKLPSWLRDSRTAVTETGKALVAYDQWGKNPARAAGAVSFNVITTVATGGAGAAAKSGAAAKAISVAGKAGRLVDPITYIGKAGKFGAVKVGDLFGSLKNLNTGAYNDVLSGQGKLQPDGTIVKIPDRVEVLPDNTLKYVTEKGETRYLTREGALLDENHKVIVQHVDQVKVQRAAPERTGGQAETPAVRAPVREPAMAGARSGEGAVGAVGRTGNDMPVTGSSGHAGGRTNQLPSGAADDLGRGPSTNHEPVPSRPHDSTPSREGSGTGGTATGEAHVAGHGARGNEGPNGAGAANDSSNEPAHGSGSDDPDTTTSHDTQTDANEPDASAEPRQGGTGSDVPDFTRPALPPGRTELTLRELRNLRPSKYRNDAAEDYLREMLDGSPERHYRVTRHDHPYYPVERPGGRKVDVPVDLPDGRTLAVEVKHYLEFRTVTLADGTKQVVNGEVPLNKGMMEQINKDLTLRRLDPGYDPRWVFTHAPPSQALRNYLIQARIVFVEYGPPPKKS
ncbi:hypothetical protein [Streptomyces sp. Je 1-332]|uniref:hypothetical protein n=1 Tax=Streptomyces sp. Je 1-332 TaxID=3231270 RepID=UPI003457EE59